MLYLTATAAYSDSPLVQGFGDVKASPEGYTRIQIRVDSKVRNIEHGETKPTGTFNYTVSIPFLKPLPHQDVDLTCCIV